MCGLFSSSRTVTDCHHGRRQCTRFKANVAPETLGHARDSSRWDEQISMALVQRRHSQLRSVRSVFRAASDLYAGEATYSLPLSRRTEQAPHAGEPARCVGGIRGSGGQPSDRQSHTGVPDCGSGDARFCVADFHLAMAIGLTRCRLWRTRSGSTRDSSNVRQVHEQHTTTDDNTLVGGTCTDTGFKIPKRMCSRSPVWRP